MRYKYKCLPRGWSQSASNFPSRMCNILVDTKAIVYFDSIGGAAQEEHDFLLEELFRRLAQTGMHINPDKVYLGRKQVMYLVLKFGQVVLGCCPQLGVIVKPLHDFFGC